ncbi:MAG: hypothetical protein E7263_12090 [Lachnospiraceae bacterium]|nr:hypothetical protein [Lachnospiraceae bacterium]
MTDAFGNKTRFIYDSYGRGIRLNLDGTFKGFIDQIR